jgi:RimJ/RimL family protein N-acetyltransferase
MHANSGESNQFSEGRKWWDRLRLNRRPVPVVNLPVKGAPQGELVRQGTLVELRRHVPANREAFQRWYADHDIARLLRHDLKPLSFVQSLVYFDTVILPSTAQGLSCAIHDRATGELIGTTGLTDLTSGPRRSCYFRIVIGESRFWSRGYGTEATRLLLAEAFERHGLDVVNLEVFEYNERAIRAYQRVGFRKVGEHIEWPEPGGADLHVLEMQIDRERFYAALAAN